MRLREGDISNRVDIQSLFLYLNHIHRSVILSFSFRLTFTYCFEGWLLLVMCRNTYVSVFNTLLMFSSFGMVIFLNSIIYLYLSLSVLLITCKIYNKMIFFRDMTFEVMTQSINRCSCIIRDDQYYPYNGMCYVARKYIVKSLVNYHNVSTTNLTLRRHSPQLLLSSAMTSSFLRWRSSQRNSIYQRTLPGRRSWQPGPPRQNSSRR